MLSIINLEYLRRCLALGEECVPEEMMDDRKREVMRFKAIRGSFADFTKLGLRRRRHRVGGRHPGIIVLQDYQRSGRAA